MTSSSTVDGKSVDGSKAVQKSVLGHNIGQKIDLGVWRDGKELKLTATTAEAMEDGGQLAQNGGGATSPKAKLGLGLQSLTPDLAERLGLRGATKGAIVSSVREGSPAQEAGVREGDVILEVDRKPVASSEDAARLLGAQRSGGHLLRVMRGEAAVFVVIPQS